MVIYPVIFIAFTLGFFLTSVLTALLALTYLRQNRHRRASVELIDLDTLLKSLAYLPPSITLKESLAQMPTHEFPRVTAPLTTTSTLIVSIKANDGLVLTDDNRTRQTPSVTAPHTLAS